MRANLVAVILGIALTALTAVSYVVKDTTYVLPIFLIQVAGICTLVVMYIRVRHLADLDPLTRTYNRASLERVTSTSENRFVLFFIDLDNFKHTNDIYGHEVGDQVLRQVATLLIESVRPTDLVFRLGGDEFVVLCYNVTAEERNQIYHRLLQRLKSAGISASIGAASSPYEGRTLSELLALADQRMYENKRAKEGGPGSADRDGSGSQV